MTPRWRRCALTKPPIVRKLPEDGQHEWECPWNDVLSVDGQKVHWKSIERNCFFDGAAVVQARI